MSREVAFRENREAHVILKLTSILVLSFEALPSSHVPMNQIERIKESSSAITFGEGYPFASSVLWVCMSLPMFRKTT